MIGVSLRNGNHIPEFANVMEASIGLPGEGIVPYSCLNCRFTPLRCNSLTPFLSDKRWGFIQAYQPTHALYHRLSPCNGQRFHRLPYFGQNDAARARIAGNKLPPISAQLQFAKMVIQALKEDLFCTKITDTQTTTSCDLRI